MHEGAFRILKALGHGERVSRKELVRASGEALSVVDDALGRYAKWFDQNRDGVACTQTGFAALGRELIARQPRNMDGVPEVSSAWRALSTLRPPPKSELDQVFATEQTVARRADLLVRQGELQRGLAFVGDDDLTSAAVCAVSKTERAVSVVEVDDEILSLLRSGARDHAWNLSTIAHDLREPLPRKLDQRFGCVFTDPPYAVEGFSLFVSRAVTLLKPDGRLYVCFGYSRRASERGLAKQRVLSEVGLLVEQVYDGFNQYDGAESIGGQSALWVCRRTPATKPVVRGIVEGPLYTSRPPNR